MFEMFTGDNTLLAFPPAARMNPSRLVADPELSPLDLAIAPNGNIVVSSERPFGALAKQRSRLLNRQTLAGLLRRPQRGCWLRLCEWRMPWGLSRDCPG